MADDDDVDEQPYKKKKIIQSKSKLVSKRNGEWWMEQGGFWCYTLYDTYIYYLYRHSVFYGQVNLLCDQMWHINIYEFHFPSLVRLIPPAQLFAMKNFKWRNRRRNSIAKYNRMHARIHYNQELLSCLCFVRFSAIRFEYFEKEKKNQQINEHTRAREYTIAN